MILNWLAAVLVGEFVIASLLSIIKGETIAGLGTSDGDAVLLVTLKNKKNSKIDYRTILLKLLILLRIY